MNRLPKYKISTIQFFAMIIATVTSFGHFVYIHLCYLVAGRDAWLSLLLGALAAVVIGPLTLKLNTSYLNGSLIQNYIRVFGKWAGILIGLFTIFFFIVAASVTLRLLMDYLATTFRKTPMQVFAILILVLVCWILYSGLEVLARTTFTALLILMALGLLASMLSMKDKDPRLLLPILDHGLSPVLQGSIIFIVMFSELIVFCMFTPNTTKARKLPKRVLIVLAVLTIMFIGPVTGPIMIFGEHGAKFHIYPTYQEIKFIQVGDFLEKLDTLGLLLWTIGSFLRISVFAYGAMKGFAELFDSDREQAFAFPVLLLILGLSQGIGDSREEIYRFLQSIYIVFGLAIGVGIPCIAAGIYMIRKKLRNI